ncbi:transmembrane protein, putative (macronuclear) [Tetrahymena thermophila SB210]|uniref:Transmembrane protein, putative n=1 Tax=Tetrahymena thermophila (strain SB210) TaxID=312017 RepID=W7X1H8_TETTS|nr:transmembrane protein, putative [Tetrahymena thermophila SB210]EWS71457.1 transmembrane protein, putative [Tetrahymena thermophila SB210]|eukprot:XP_012656023.1 transmembrane protein, putative [Tetrahymena thermophila SB210]
MFDQTTTPPPLPNQIYGCGCTSNKKTQMSVSGLYGYDYTFDNGNLKTLPFWLCESVNDDYVPTLIDYSKIYSCFIYSYNSPNDQQKMDPNVCSTSGSFIQTTFDDPPYYNYTQFLYMIGFIFLTIFGLACNFPMTYLLLMFQYKTVPMKEYQPSSDRRKILICYALKKVLMIDRINKQVESLGIQNQLIPVMPMSKRLSKNDQQHQKQQAPLVDLQQYIKNIKLPDNQSISYFRKEILDELLEFLYTDNVHYHIVKRRQQSVRNRNQSHYTNSHFINQSQVDQNNRSQNNNLQLRPQVSQNQSITGNQIVININQLLNIEPNIPQNPSQDPPQQAQNLEQTNAQRNLNTFSADNSRLGEIQSLNQTNQMAEIDRTQNHQQDQRNYQQQVVEQKDNRENEMNNQDNNQIQAFQSVLARNDQQIKSMFHQQISTHHKKNSIDYQLQQLNLKTGKSSKYSGQTKLDEFQSEDYRNDEDIQEEEIQWNKQESNNENGNDINSSNLHNSAQQYSGNNIQFMNRHSNQLISTYRNNNNNDQQNTFKNLLSDPEIQLKQNENSHQVVHFNSIPEIKLENEDHKQIFSPQNEDLNNKKYDFHEHIGTQPCETSFLKHKSNEQNHQDSPQQFLQKLDENNMNQINLGVVQEIQKP